jgi:hypothetical protein
MRHPVLCVSICFAPSQVVERAFHIFYTPPLVLRGDHKHILPFTAVKNKNKAK